MIVIVDDMAPPCPAFNTMYSEAPFSGGPS